MKTKEIHPIYRKVRESGNGRVSVTDTAKLVRGQLKAAFPNVKFSVRSDSYSMGASIDVKWTDGPTSSQVDEILHGYAGAGFDGMIDMKYHKSHFLHADGSTSLARDEGTQGSRGSCPEQIGDPADGSAIEVRFGADYVMGSRNQSEESTTELARKVWAEFGVEIGGDMPERVKVERGEWTYFEWTRNPRIESQYADFGTLVYREFAQTSYD